jgi:hypothetical protein
MSAAARACSKPADWPFVRNSTAISLAGVPARMSAAMAAATPPASASSSSYAVNDGLGPGSACASRRSGSGPPMSPGRCWRSTRLARPTTWGVER